MPTEGETQKRAVYLHSQRMMHDTDMLRELVKEAGLTGTVGGYQMLTLIDSIRLNTTRVVELLGTDALHTCHRCGRNFRVDLNVPDKIWEQISPDRVAYDKGGGLLCGYCIVTALEQKGFGAWELVEPTPLSGIINERPWQREDLNHLDEAIDFEKARSNAISMPGLESVRDQIAIRLSSPTRYKDHDQ